MTLCFPCWPTWETSFSTSHSELLLVLLSLRTISSRSTCPRFFSSSCTFFLFPLQCNSAFGSFSDMGRKGWPSKPPFWFVAPLFNWLWFIACDGSADVQPFHGIKYQFLFFPFYRHRRTGRSGPRLNPGIFLFPTRFPDGSFPCDYFLPAIIFVTEVDLQDAFDFWFKETVAAFFFSRRGLCEVLPPTPSNL